MYCKNCGRELRPGVKFCAICGQRVEFIPEPENATVVSGADNRFSEPENTTVVSGADNDSYGTAEENYDIPAPVQPVPVNIPNPQAAPVNNGVYPQMPQQPYSVPNPQVVITQASAQTENPAHRPISAWAYFGYSILFAIPVVGLIVNIILCLSDDNINLRNYARSYWCFFVVFIVVAMFVAIIAAATGGALFYGLEEMFY